mgnify:CR=1 FL=1
MNRDWAFATAATVASMRPTQLYGVAKRVVRSDIYPLLPTSIDDRYEQSAPPATADTDPVAATVDALAATASIETRDRATARADALRDGTVTFLNRDVDGATVDAALGSLEPTVGEDAGYPLLWSLKLWSFEPVEWLAFGAPDPGNVLASTMVDWLASWQDAGFTSADRPGYLRGYWTPYAVSRRIVNCARLLAILGSDAPADRRARVATHVAKNLEFLRDHVEHDIGGNHLVENACALVVGGVLLDDDDVVSEGVALLTETVPSQLLASGVHFERSPMYHAILLYRVADAVALLDRTDRRAPASVVEALRAMHAWLRDVAPPGARLPLCNDAAYGEAPSRASALAFAERVLDRFEPAASIPTDASGSADASDGTTASVRTDRSTSRVRGDYFALRDDRWHALVDGDRQAMPHLPAHGHNDVASVLAWLDGDPLLVDTGVYDYARGERRQYARSVTAHNTVQVDDLEQSVVGGRYAMGPQLDPDAWTVDDADRQSVVVDYRAPRLRPRYRHRREVSLRSGRLRVDDWLRSKRATATARLHLAPEVDVHRRDTDASGTVTFELALPSDATVAATVHGADAVDVLETERYPEYGLVVTQPTIEATFAPSDDADSDPSLTTTLDPDPARSGE